MSELSGKQVKNMKEAYASIYSNVNEEVSEEVYEENENEALMLEWYNALVEEGYIAEGKWSAVKDILKKAAKNAAKTVTGFGLTPDAPGTKRKVLTTLAVAKAADNPQAVVDATVTGAKTAMGAIRGGKDTYDKLQKEKEKKEKKTNDDSWMDKYMTSN